jgi:UDP-N-acetylmuramoylalanine--D-glutamate ligase
VLIDMDTGFLSGKTVLVMGLGRFGGGVDSARFAHQCSAKVMVTDLAATDELAGAVEELKGLDGIEWRLGGHERSDFERADIVIVNPAVHPQSEFVQHARQCGKVVTSQIELFFELCPARIIGITGSNGKSTTTALTAHLLRAGLGRQGITYSNVWLGGNIGNEPMLCRLGQITAADVVVLELSSFQLEQLAESGKAPQVALITNLTPNHLDRHVTFPAYSAAKEKIFSLQRLSEEQPAVSIFNADDPITNCWFDKYRGQAGRICLLFRADDVSGELRQNLQLPGRANLENLAAAVVVARQFGVTEEQMKQVLPDFKPLPHRLEFVAKISDVGWYNDSIATTPASTMVALEAFEQPKIIIAGGYDKNLPFDQLGRQIAGKAKAVILLGQTAEAIARAVRAVPRSEVPIEIVDSLGEAVKVAAQMAKPGDVVLLSPACASYDMFENFQQRGEIFRQLVGLLSESL